MLFKDVEHRVLYITVASLAPSLALFLVILNILLGLFTSV